ncbi:MAG TPA: TRAP transporter small permease subunit [Salinisphaeraceae bacterium]|nr:TRAP transporter small permease subunit [Salinisphaeraceae bacterium]
MAVSVSEGRDMKFLLASARMIDGFGTFVGKIMWWAALGMVLIGVYNVITRYIGQYIGVQLSANVYIEMQTYAFDLIFMLGAAYVLNQDGHVRVDIFYSRLGARAKAWIDIFGTFAFLLPFCVFALYFSFGYVERSWKILEQSPNPGGLPRYPLKSVILITFVMLFLQGLSEAIKNAAFLRGIPGYGPSDDKHAHGATDQTDAL